MSNQSYINGQGSNGTLSIVAPAGPGVVWNLTSLSISQAGPTIGPNAKVEIRDGTLAAGTVIHAEYLPGAGAGSVGNTYQVKIPLGPNNKPSLQASPGNVMTVTVTGTGANLVSANARFTDGLSD